MNTQDTTPPPTTQDAPRAPRIFRVVYTHCIVRFASSAAATTPAAALAEADRAAWSDPRNTIVDCDGGAHVQEFLPGLGWIDLGWVDTDDLDDDDDDDEEED